MVVAGGWAHDDDAVEEFPAQPVVGRLVEVVGGVAAGVDGMEVGQTFVEVDPADRQWPLDEAGDVQRLTERPVLRLLRHRVTVHRHSCHGATPPRIRTAHLL